MDTIQSNKIQIEKTLAEIYSRMAAEEQRKVDQSYGLSGHEIENAKRGHSFPSHRTPERPLTEGPEENNRLQQYGFRMTWDEAIKRFNVPNIYKEVSLEKVEKLNPKLSEIGRRWLEIDSKPTIVLSGTPGGGKTFFAYSLLRGLVMQNKHRWLLFTNSFDLDNELLKSQLSEDEVILKYQEVPILFLDDLGVERISDRMLRQYYAIINSRLNNLFPTVFTTNIPVEKIHEKVGDRIASRLKTATEIKFPDKDLRKQIFS